MNLPRITSLFLASLMGVAQAVEVNNASSSSWLDFGIEFGRLDPGLQLNLIFDSQLVTVIEVGDTAVSASATGGFSRDGYVMSLEASGGAAATPASFEPPRYSFATSSSAYVASGTNNSFSIVNTTSAALPIFLSLNAQTRLQTSTIGDAKTTTYGFWNAMFSCTTCGTPPPFEFRNYSLLDEGFYEPQDPAASLFHADSLKVEWLLEPGDDFRVDTYLIAFSYSQALPEPGTWALLLAGLGLLAVASSRRHHGTAVH